MTCPYCNSNIDPIAARYSVPDTIKHATAYGTAHRYEVNTRYSCKSDECKARLRAEYGVKVE